MFGCLSSFTGLTVLVSPSQPAIGRQGWGFHKPCGDVSNRGGAVFAGNVFFAAVQNNLYPESVIILPGYDGTSTQLRPFRDQPIGLGLPQSVGKYRTEEVTIFVTRVL